LNSEGTPQVPRSNAVKESSIEKGKRGPRDALEQSSFGLGACKNPNTEQNAEQQSREVCRNAARRDRSLGLRRRDRSAEKRLKLAKALGNSGTQLLVVRHDFKCRVDQKTLLSFPIAYRAIYS
jgi:hypothetical protein